MAKATLQKVDEKQTTAKVPKMAKALVRTLGFIYCFLCNFLLN